MEVRTSSFYMLDGKPEVYSFIFVCIVLLNCTIILVAINGWILRLLFFIICSVLVISMMITLFFYLLIK